jgi:hypothetical protein
MSITKISRIARVVTDILSKFCIMIRKDPELYFHSYKFSKGRNLLSRDGLVLVSSIFLEQ